MFTSKKFLSDEMGVDPEIAAFFVDRKVPSGNLYWKGRLLYVSKGTGFLFIPLFFDLQYRSGVPKAILLSEPYVSLMEDILDSAASYEREQQDFGSHLAKCMELVAGRTANRDLYQDLSFYFGENGLRPYKMLGTPSMALNRGDTLLFLLCCLRPGDGRIGDIIRDWYALVPSFLLMDDVMDLEEDAANGEENSIGDFGEGREAVRNAIAYLHENFARLRSVNGKLGAYFEDSLQEKLETPYLQFLIK
ncbi:MAG: hypothetical protein P4L51_08790 [Puia sp.]|nr:hypothetical protein [Puia sp.]